MSEDVRIIHGDCLEVLPTLDRASIAAVVTDPPYGIGNTRERARATTGQRAAGLGDRDWDTRPARLDWLADFDVPAIVWGGNYFSLPPSRGWLAWVKPDAPPSMANIELAWTNRDVNARAFTWSIGQTNAERVGHPTQKPLALMLWCLKQLNLPPGSLVLDPYAGSGTTAIACMKTGRRCIAIEREAKYVEIIRRRVAEARTPLFDRLGPADENQP